MSSTLNDLTEDYFQYVAQHFPVMCASDEFHFLPRAQAASRYYDRLDSLSERAISECICALKAFQRKCDLLASHETALERLIDLDLLKANMAGILIELEMKQSWRYNPLLYLKIAFIGLEHALTKPAAAQKEREERTLARLDNIARLLEQGSKNLTRVPRSYYEGALLMVHDCRAYLEALHQNWPQKGSRRIPKALQQATVCLDAFGQHLKNVSPAPQTPIDTVSVLEATLKQHFLCALSLSEIFHIAVEEWHDSLAQLAKLKAAISPAKSWQQIYHRYCPREVSDLDTLSLYGNEIKRLERFFNHCGFALFASCVPLKLCETPTFLKSVRGSASFSAAFSQDIEESSLFYLTTSRTCDAHRGGPDLLRNRLHREYRFLCAHETFPGHHVLDSVRRNLANPVRRQIESPLFYEGWASYAESLLRQYGYVDDLMDALVEWKRRLWRAARCQIDVGLNTGQLTEGDAIALLKTAGFVRREAQAQIGRFRLNPGYQLCYTLGRHEITRLKKRFGSTMGRDAFHKFLLLGGELPFHLVEKRFKKKHITALPK